MKELDDIKSNITAACVRLHEHTVRIKECSEQGAPFEEIERAMSDRRSLAQHIRHMCSVQLGPIVLKAEREKFKSCPAEIAQIENEILESRGEAVRYLEDNMVTVVLSCIQAGAKISPDGHSILFRDTGLTQFIRQARSLHDKERDGAKERRLFILKDMLHRGPDPGVAHAVYAAWGEAFQQATEQSGFNPMEDFNSVLD